MSPDDERVQELSAWLRAQPNLTDIISDAQKYQQIFNKEVVLPRPGARLIDITHPALGAAYFNRRTQTPDGEIYHVRYGLGDSSNRSSNFVREDEFNFGHLRGYYQSRPRAEVTNEQRALEVSLTDEFRHQTDSLLSEGIAESDLAQILARFISDAEDDFQREHSGQADRYMLGVDLTQPENKAFSIMHQTVDRYLALKGGDLTRKDAERIKGYIDDLNSKMVIKFSDRAAVLVGGGLTSVYSALKAYDVSKLNLSSPKPELVKEPPAPKPVVQLTPLVTVTQRLPQRHEIGAYREGNIFDQVSTALKEKGEFHADLTDSQVTEIMSGVITGLLAGQERIKASVPSIKVRIERGNGLVNGVVLLEKPLNATIRVYCVLGNDSNPQRIKLNSLDIVQEAGFKEKIALKVMNIEGKAKSILQDPNKALNDVLSSELKSRGVALTELGLHFSGNSLAVNLKGKP